MAKGKNLKKPRFKTTKVQPKKLTERRAYRTAKRYAGPAGVALLIILIGYSLFLPKNQFQQAKEHLVQNPNDFQAHLILAQEFLKNNQFKQAEKELLAIQASSTQVLGEDNNFNLERLWQKKHYSDPKDIRQLIAGWEKVVVEKPDYRDAYLQLAWLHYQIFENEKAKNYLQKALILDPNYESAHALQKIID